MYKTSAISFDYVDPLLISATVAFTNEFFWHSNVAYLVQNNAQIDLEFISSQMICTVT
jgi:hypothetical protein